MMSYGSFPSMLFLGFWQGTKRRDQHTATMLRKTVGSWPEWVRKYESATRSNEFYTLKHKSHGLFCTFLSHNTQRGGSDITDQYISYQSRRMVRVWAVLSGSSLSKGEAGAVETVQRSDESMREQEHRGNEEQALELYVCCLVSETSGMNLHRHSMSSSLYSPVHPSRGQR